MDIVCVARRENILGEGPCWSPVEGRLYWADIRRNTLEWLHPGDGSAGVFQLEVSVSALSPRVSGGLLLATSGGFATFDASGGVMKMAHHPEPERAWNRSNDGHTDRAGRFWLGTMDDREQERSGAVYKLNPDWTSECVLDGLGVPNTLAWSPDGKTFYLADSKDQALYAFDADPASGLLGERRLFASTQSEGGAPDGSAVDAEGGLWNAQWGGGRVVRYAPDGSIDRIVAMPVTQPTSCAFGGADLSTLYVTSARAGLLDAALAEQPLAGGLFAFKPGVRGLALASFAG